MDTPVDPLKIADRELGSRLVLGTGGAPSLDVLERAVVASGTELVTVALRRIDPQAPGSVLEVLDRLGVAVLPNTAGCYTATEAVRTARENDRDRQYPHRMSAGRANDAAPGMIAAASASNHCSRIAL